MTTTSVTKKPTEPRGTREVVVIETPEQLVFSNDHDHYVHTDIFNEIQQLTIRDLEGAKITFVGDPIKGYVEPVDDPWAPNRGVVNFDNCHSCAIDYLNVENTFKYRNDGGQDSTAVSFRKCTDFDVTNSRIVGNGKCALVVSDSRIYFAEMDITSYYFGLMQGGSQTTFKHVKFHQWNPDVPDSHAAIWLTSRVTHMRNKLTFRDAEFHLKSGRAIFAGNGPLDATSEVMFENFPLMEFDDVLGIVPLTGNYHGIHVLFEEITPFLNNVVDPAKPEDRGLIGRFVDYHHNGERPNSEAPITIQGLSSNDL